MLVAISGSQGTGKSTLLETLSTHFPTVSRKTSRSILSDWNVTLSRVNNDHDLTIKFQEEILKRKIEDELIFAQDPDAVFLTERTYADLFVYALVALGKDNQYSDWLDEYYVKCENAQRSYVGVFYLAGGLFAPVNDGVRAINTHYSSMVDSTMEHYTKWMLGSHQRFEKIFTPHLDERVSIVLSYTSSIIK